MEIIGDWGCPAIDVDQWFVQNQAPVFTGMLNVWIVRHQVKGTTPFETVQARGLQLVQEWLGESAVGLKVERISSEAIAVEPAVTTYRALQQPLLADPDVSHYIWLRLTFRWDSPAPRVPWFVRNEGGMLSLPAAKRCPVKPEWFLETIGQAIATSTGELTTPASGNKGPRVRFDVFPKDARGWGTSAAIVAAVAAGLGAGWLYLNVRDPDVAGAGRGR